MKKWMDPIGIVIVAAAVVSAAGCPRSAPSSTSASPRKSPAEPGLEQTLSQPFNDAATVHVAAMQAVPEVKSPEMPEVVMTAEHFDRLVYQPGESIPQATLLDAFGQEQSLAKLLSPTATLLLLWDLDAPYAKEQFLNLGLEVLQEYGDGLAVVTINYDDEPSQLRTLVAEREIKFPVLLAAPNSDEMPFPEELHLPQVYLLDGAGVVAWCDVEYSLHSQRRLDQAVRNLLERGTQTAVGGDVPTAR